MDTTTEIAANSRPAKSPNQRSTLTAFVTGATGFLGSHVAQQLADQGADLRLLVRATSNVRNISAFDKAERVTGDLRDPASLKKATTADTPTTGSSATEKRARLRIWS